MGNDVWNRPSRNKGISHFFRSVLSQCPDQS
jgi:hypothetical protein